MALFPVLLAFLLALSITPIVLRLSLAINFVDRPDGHRKLHQSAVALGGGVAILASFLISLLVIQLVNLPGAADLARVPYFTIGLCGAATLICLVGLMDDRFELRGRQKLAAQVLCVFVTVSAGLVIEGVELFGYRIELGVLSIPFTVLWLLGAINALNLIDGIDGLAGTIAVILSLTIAVLAAMTGHLADAVFACVLGGACLGFLVFNLPPARIYLGDAGSMVIGLILGALAIRSSLKGPATVALAAPTAIWAILAFDIAMAIMRRKLTGRSIYHSDRSHMHHVLQKHGYSVKGVLIVMGGLCLLCSIGTLASVALTNEFLALGTAASVLAILVFTGLFGRAECALFARRLSAFVRSLGRIDTQSERRPVHVCSRFYGNREWEILWDSIINYAERFELSGVQLNISSPSIGEEYHAVWKSPEQPPALRVWRTEIPLFLREICVGRLKIMGGIPEGETIAWMAELIGGLKPFETHMQLLLEEILPPRRPALEILQETQGKNLTVSPAYDSTPVMTA